MRQIKVNAPEGGVFRDNHVECCPDAATDVDECSEALKAIVSLENFLHSEGGVIGHSLVEHLVESWVGAVILERTHSISLVKRNSTIHNCIFQMIPTLNKHKLIKLVK